MLERRAAAPYADAIVAAILTRATGGAPANVTTTGAVEAAASLMGRAFASATLTPPVSAVSASILGMMGREIIRRGEAVFLIDVDGAGLRLTPATGWEITGGVEPETWTYRLQLAGPSQDVTRYAPAAGVVHIRPYVEPSAPWRGIAPIEVGGVDRPATRRD